MDLTKNCLVILLHGVGSSGADLLPLSQGWKEALPGAAFAAPDAPFPAGFGSGRQWFSVAGVTTENRPGRVADARTGFDATINAIIRQNGFQDRLDRVAFVGFSQGSIMALDAVASGRWPVGAVVAFSGRLASPTPLSPAQSTPMLLIHGAADGVIPSGETTEAGRVLAGLGLAVETLLLPGVGHTISADGASHAGAFLARVLG